ncbi:MAG TPA: protease modulator HflC [Candidatus Binatia bacterium]|nr:protease modulator HflC [Candidatus Binatia bacterium]
MGNRQLLTFALIGLVLVTALNSVYRVDARERALVFQLGEIRTADPTPGLHLKAPFLQSVRRFDARLQTLDAPGDNFVTQDKQDVDVDYYAKWQIADTAAYYRGTGGDETVAADRLSASLTRVLRDSLAARTVEQALVGPRAELVAAVTQASQADAAALGVRLVDMAIKRVDFPQAVRDKVYERMRADRQRVAAELQARGREDAERIRADADREAQVILAGAYTEAERTRGEGDARAAEIYAKAYGQDAEFYRFYRSLMAYREAMAGGGVLVLRPDSEFFRYFRAPGGGAR